MLQSHVPGAPDTNKPPAYFGESLNDAERLLKYAAEIGIDVDPDTRAAILHARTAYTHGGWDDHVGAALLIALTQLAARLHPVTAESLKAYHAETRPTVRTYSVWAIILASIILPVSIATFVTSAVSSSLRDDITKANSLAVKLHAELPAGKGTSLSTLPTDISMADVIGDLQEYASTVRAINARARKLNHFILPHQRRPVEDEGTPDQRKHSFELDPGFTDPIAERDKITNTYQDVRYFAQMLITDVSVFYGAISTVILPVLYALLGTCAYLIRSFEDQMSRRTFTPSAANSARFLIAGIGGLVVGLFSNFAVTQQASLPPLALAFLIGYAVDVFFAFLEGLIKTFTRSPAPSPVAPPPPLPNRIPKNAVPATETTSGR